MDNDLQLNFRRNDASAAGLLRQIHRRHLSAAAVAVVLSVALHILLVALFPDITWTFPLKRESKERYPQVKLQKVEAEPEPVTARPARFRPENPALKVDLPAEVEQGAQKIDEAMLEPKVPEQAGGLLAGEAAPLRPHAGAEGRTTWDPRQEIIMIDKTIVDAPLPMLPRRYVAAIPRVRSAADLVFAADRDEAATSPLGGAGSGGPGDIDLDRLNLQRTPAGWGEGGRAAVRGAPPARARLAPTSETARIVGEEPSRISPRRPIEKYLVAEVTRYEPALGQYGYCTIEIRRINEDLLPVLPKDIVLVQDSSASIAEQRLYFCREGWLKSLALIGPQDRFNVVAFRDRALRCFADWAPPTAENLEQARQFVAGMEARGNTDIYGSLRSLLEEKRDPRRPLIALVVSDGLPTVGETDSARIIEDFSQANRGQLSVFTCGTIGVANRYLLDLVSYRNRGDTYIVTSGRWDIPAAVENRMRSITRPVMSDMRFIFSAASRSEVYPALTANLYLDRPLILFCRYPVDSRFLVFQVTGTAGETACDMIFKLNLADAKAGTEDLKTRWAWQRAYALIGEHTRTRDPAILRELKRLSAAYRLTIPYQAEMREGDR